MGRYLEYEISSGRILSELKCDGEAEASEGLGLLEISGDAEVDTCGYAVRGGRLVRAYETAEERSERERLRKERSGKVRERLKSMVYEVNIAILENDTAALEELRREYRELKAFMR